MAFNRPTLIQLVQRITADLETNMGIIGAALRRAFTKLLAKVIAGIAHMLHGHLDYNAKQLSPKTADEDNLKQWADVYGLSPNPASFADGFVTLTGVDGSPIVSGTELVSSDSVSFKTTADGLIAAGVAIVAVRASVAGEDGNAELGTVLSLAAPVSGIDAEATVTTAIDGGADGETVEELRERLLERIQQPPSGGGPQDYKAWAKEVTGVTRAWSYPLYLGPGTVGVFFMRDNDDDSVFPSVGEVQDVSAHIELKRPVTARSYVFAPSADEIDFSITISPDSTEVRDAVEQELTDLLARAGEPGGVIYLSQIREACSIAAGEIDNVVHQPSADVNLANGYLPTMGTISWS